MSFALKLVLYTDPIQVSAITLEWSEIMGTYITSDTALRGRRQKYVVK